MTLQTSLLLMSLCLIVISIQTCPICTCCKNGQDDCGPDKNCNNGCKHGYYGEQCTRKCPVNCKTCSNIYSCTQCRSGFYTEQCHGLCGKGCVNNTCELGTGTCTCISTDFQKGKCEYCSDNKYGDKCNNTCPSNCENCISDTDCSYCKDYLYYGTYCQYKCPHGCYNEQCNKENGQCKYGCKHGYTGDKCQTCSAGKYGYNCNLDCGGYCSVCSSITNCTECKEGFYGETCRNICSAGCNGGCLFADGSCLHCMLNLSGSFCNNTCETGTYGINCSKLCSDEDENCEMCKANEFGIYQNCTQCKIGYYIVWSNEHNYSKCSNCPINCKYSVCDTAELCTNGCLEGTWGDKCSNKCEHNCVECDQMNGKCLKCTMDTFSDNCSQNCSIECNTTERGSTCAMDTGKCLQGCKSLTRYGDYCAKQCNESCIKKRCDWKTGHCLGCVIGKYGSFCDKRCADTCKSEGYEQVICDKMTGHCLYGCKIGFHGDSCGEECNSQCVNKTCCQRTAECLYGCIDGYEGTTCDHAIRQIGDVKDKQQVIIATSVGAIILVAMLIILVFFIIKRKRRQRSPSNKMLEENETVQNIQDISIENDEIELGAVYIEPFQNTYEDDNDTDYAITYDDHNRKKISDRGNQTDVKCVNAEYEYVGNDTTHDITNNKALDEETYDTTHDITNNKLNNKNEYALLNLRSNRPGHIDHPNREHTEHNDVYDNTEVNKDDLTPRSNKDYDFLHSNKGNIELGFNTSNTVYDTTFKGTRQKISSLNRGYSEVCINNK